MPSSISPVRASIAGGRARGPRGGRAARRRGKDRAQDHEQTQTSAPRWRSTAIWIVDITSIGPIGGSKLVCASVPSSRASGWNSSDFSVRTSPRASSRPTAEATSSRSVGQLFLAAGRPDRRAVCIGGRHPVDQHGHGHPPNAARAAQSDRAGFRDLVVHPLARFAALRLARGRPPRHPLPAGSRPRSHRRRARCSTSCALRCPTRSPRAPGVDPPLGDLLALGHEVDGHLDHRLAGAHPGREQTLDPLRRISAARSLAAPMPDSARSSSSRPRSGRPRCR
jgi:hypothetical protein